MLGFQNFPQIEGGKDGSKNQWDDWSLKTEWAAGDDVRAGQCGCQDWFLNVSARYGESEYVSLCEVPCPVDADRKP